MDKILIVGGSRGIGNEILKNLVSKYECHNISRTIPELEHSNLTNYQLDVTADDFPEIENLKSLVYCPGSITLKPLGSLKIEDFKLDFEVNVLGAIRVIKHYLKSLKKNGSASITLFSTVAVSQGMPFHSSIAVAKAGVEALSKSLAAELAPNIRVNCVAPSITDTPLAKNILRSEKSRENIINKHPLKKILTAEEVSNMACFLMSDSASGITGQVIGVDAGLSNLKL